MARKNNRTRTEARPLSLEGFRSVETEQPQGSARDRYGYRREKYDKFGSPEQRGAYITASLGRPISEDTHLYLTELFHGKISGTHITRTGIVYASGQEIAKRTNFGLSQSGDERKTPEEVIDTICQRFLQSGELPQSATTRIRVPLIGLGTKRWGRHKARIVAEVGDIPKGTNSPGQILDEKLVAATRLSPEQIPAVPTNIEDIWHRVGLLVIDLSDLAYAKSVIMDNPIRPSTMVTLEGLGHVENPLPFL